MIYTGNSKEINPEKMHNGDVKKVKKRVLIGKEQNAPNFIMRHFTVQKGGYSPHHEHKHEHEVFILSGRGMVKDEKGAVEVKAGDFIYVPPDQKHQFQNPHEESFEFLCLIPSDHK